MQKLQYVVTFKLRYTKEIPTFLVVGVSPWRAVKEAEAKLAISGWSVRHIIETICKEQK